MDKVGICGDNCSYCPRYLATKGRNLKKLENVKGLWVRLNLRNANFPIKNMACAGCKPENKCAYPKIASCARKKKLRNCGQCKQYPCGGLLSVFKKSRKLSTKARKVCTNREFKMLKKAFFDKRKYLDKINQKENH